MAEMTDLLRSAAAGDSVAAERLFERVYGDLKRIAHGRLYRSGGVAGLNTTGLVHECFLRLAEHGRLEATDRQQFFGYVARVMRNVVVDEVRAQRASKRGGGEAVITLTTGVEAEAIDDGRLLAIHEALDGLERIAPAYRELVELRYFGGLTVAELAELRGVSTRSIEREWEKARAFLLRLMQEA